MKQVKYVSNNSGGDWPLSERDWKALEQAGWSIGWKTKPFLGTLATIAYRNGLELSDAIAEFESVTGKAANEEGCAHCGKPHEFSICGEGRGE